MSNPFQKRHKDAHAVQEVCALLLFYSRDIEEFTILELIIRLLSVYIYSKQGGSVPGSNIKGLIKCSLSPCIGKGQDTVLSVAMNAQGWRIWI